MCNDQQKKSFREVAPPTNRENFGNENELIDWYWVAGSGRLLPVLSSKVLLGLGQLLHVVHVGHAREVLEKISLKKKQIPLTILSCFFLLQAFFFEYDALFYFTGEMYNQSLREWSVRTVEYGAQEVLKSLSVSSNSYSVALPPRSVGICFPPPPPRP